MTPRVASLGEEPGNQGDGAPDGIKVDNNGNLFVTGPKGTWVWTQSGKHIGTIVTPEQHANLTWGDHDYRTLYRPRLYIAFR